MAKKMRKSGRIDTQMLKGTARGDMNRRAKKGRGSRGRY